MSDPERLRRLAELDCSDTALQIELRVEHARRGVREDDRAVVGNAGPARWILGELMEGGKCFCVSFAFNQIPTAQSQEPISLSSSRLLNSVKLGLPGPAAGGFTNRYCGTLLKGVLSGTLAGRSSDL